MASIFEPLRTDFGASNVVVEGDDGYEKAVHRWSVLSERKARAVIFPSTPEQVSTTVKFAASNEISFAVCGGGHSAAATSSSDGGMVIDLRRMRKVNVDTDKQTVTFEGGCLWSDVNDALWAKDLATVGGTVSHTGVGGLILGGGFGFLTGKRGFCVDNLLSVEIVVADGSILTASDTENADLFWAVRGAGSTFGVVTKFTSKAYPQGNVWAGMLVFPLDRAEEIAAASSKFLELSDGNQGALLVLAHGPPPERTPAISLMAFHNGDAESAKHFFAPFLELGPIVNTTSMVPYPVVNSAYDDFFAHGKRWKSSGANFVAPLQTAVLKDAAESMFAFTGEHPDAQDGFGVAFELIPNKVTGTVPLGSMAFANRGDYYGIALLFGYTDPRIDNEVAEFLAKLRTQIAEKGFQRKVGSGVGQYANFSVDEADAELVFGPNAEKVIELKKKWDPTNVFKKPWKLVRG